MWNQHASQTWTKQLAKNGQCHWNCLSCMIEPQTQTLSRKVVLSAIWVCGWTLQRCFRLISSGLFLIPHIHLVRTAWFHHGISRLGAWWLAQVLGRSGSARPGKNWPVKHFSSFGGCGILNAFCIFWLQGLRSMTAQSGCGMRPSSYLPWARHGRGKRWTLQGWDDEVEKWSEDVLAMEKWRFKAFRSRRFEDGYFDKFGRGYGCCSIYFFSFVHKFLFTCLEPSSSGFK